MAWNRRHASDPPAENGPLAWSITAMRETTDQLFQAGSTDHTDGFAMISEAVWWITLVDATMIRYHPDVYGAMLAGQAEAEGRVIEDTFGGLRFVRNRMGYVADPAEFIQPGRGFPAGQLDPGGPCPSPPWPRSRRAPRNGR